RPPGHHAEPDRGMGFCLVNHIAVAAAALAAEGERVLVVDWDVHHGNGTQAAFWDRPDVLFVSTHQWPLYPGSGRSTATAPRPPSGTGPTSCSCPPTSGRCTPAPAGPTTSVVRAPGGSPSMCRSPRGPPATSSAGPSTTWPGRWSTGSPPPGCWFPPGSTPTA